MPVQILRPNLVQDAEDAGDFTLYPSSASLVGTASTLWRDDNAATYAEMTYQFGVSGGDITPTRQDFARAPLDLLSVDSSTATLNSVLVEITGEQLLDNVGSTDGVSVFVNLTDATSYDVGFGDYTVQWQAAALLNNTRDGSDLYGPGDWSNFTHRDTATELTASEVLDFFASGNAVVHGTVADSTTTTGTYTVSGRIFDVTVTIDYTLIATPLPPPLRRYPPVGNHGFGPTRHYPHPPARRGAGGAR